MSSISSSSCEVKSSRLTRLKKDIVKYKVLYLFILPVLIYYIIFHYIPMYGTTLAFKEYNIGQGIFGSPWIGLDNFKQLFNGISFPQVFRNSVIINTYKLIFGFPAPILLALLLNEIYYLKFKKIVQTVSYFPYFLSWIVLYGILLDFLSPSIGPINSLISLLGGKPIYFLGDPNWFRFTLVWSTIWKNVGYGTIIYLAAIAGINPEMYEAAIVDGANRFKRMFYITIPSLVPMITIMFILNIGSLIKDDFDQIYNLLNPAVYEVGDVIATYVYRSGIVDFNISIATAAGLFQNVIALILVIGTNMITKRFNEYGIW